MVKDRMSLVLFKLIGGSSQQDQVSRRKKEIKVSVAVMDDGSQPLPVKLNLTTLESLKRSFYSCISNHVELHKVLFSDLDEYMGDYIDEASVITGIVLEEASGEQILVTQVDQIDVEGCPNYIVKKLVKRGKQYFSVIRN